MNNMTDPVKNLLQDQFTDNPQLATVVAMTDAFFGKPIAIRKPTLEDRLDEVVALANRLDLLLLEIAKQDPHNANIEEAQEFAQGILLNVAGYRKEISAPYVPCDCPCDSCVAARSDEHYDRKRDGMAA